MNDVPDWLWQGIATNLLADALVAAGWLAQKYGADWYYIARYQLTKPFKPPPITKATLVVEVVELN